MSESVYRTLAHHLDDLPGGFPPTDSGLELRILKRLFTEEEAEFALHLTLLAEPPRVIARRAGITPDEAAGRLESMARKGLIYRIYKDGDPLYMALQFIIGIWEFHVNDLDRGLIEDVNEYLPHFFDHSEWGKAPQLRTIPIRQDITVEHEVLPYEQAEQLVRGRKKIAVAPCICRREHDIMDRGCDHPEETCLVFGRAADYYVENGMGRYIDVEETLAILRKADESGLVLQPSNSQNVTNICCCCGCSCQVLKAFKRHPEPASLVSSPYLAAVDEDACIACGDCQARCQMEAISLDDGYSKVDLVRCIGCGLCVTTCQSGAMTLVRKPEQEQKPVPANQQRSYLNLARARGKLTNTSIAMMALRSARDRLRS
jgi:ferredoxin